VLLALNEPHLPLRTDAMKKEISRFQVLQSEGGEWIDDAFGM